jgi:hypothetical protein
MFKSKARAYTSGATLGASLWGRLLTLPKRNRQQAWARLEKYMISNIKISISEIICNISISQIGLFKISPFRMEKFEINEQMQNETFLQKPVFEMSHFDIIKAKNLILHHLRPKNLV